MNVFWIKNCIEIVGKVFKQTCDTCNFDSDKDKLKIYKILEQQFTHCHNCDKSIEHGEVVVTHFFNMNVFQSVKFRDKWLKEIAQMVNYSLPFQTCLK